MLELETLATWMGCGQARRAQVRAGIARTLGRREGALVGHYELAEIVGPEGRFVAIPGGVFEMGLRDADLARVEHLGIGDDLVRRARPIRRVTIRPFLCARSPLRDRDGALEFFDAEEATRALARRRGFRVMSEAEWEYVARNCGQTSFLGTDDPRAAVALVEAATEAEDDPESTVDDQTALGLRALPWGEFVADGWHPDYIGAPRQGPWDPPRHLTCFRGGTANGFPYQRESDVVECLAALRSPPPPSDRLCLRLARELPLA